MERSMKKVNLTIVCVCAIMMVSCTPMYVSNRQNVPLLTKEGEIRASGSIGSGGIDVQAAGAITKETAVMVNAQMADMEHNYYDFYEDVSKVTQKSIEVALGHYKPVGSNGVFEIYAGYGIGSSNRKEGYPDRTTKGNFYKIFVQPNVGFHTKYFSAGFGIRAQYIQYDRLRRVETDNEQMPVTKTYTFKTNANGFFVEPTVTLKTGLENFKITGQIGATLPFSNIDYDHSLLMANLGFEFTIGK